MGTSKQTAEILSWMDHVVRDGRFRNVLITGETGVGKGVVASALHRLGPRRDGPFLRIVLASLPDQLAEAELFGTVLGSYTDSIDRPGLVQASAGGILFLDEIGTASPALQSKLLTVVEDKRVRRVGGSHDHHVDTWIIAATNEDLERAMEEGRFRRDLYHRLAARELRIPPLRERPDDVVAIARHLVRELARESSRPEPFLSPDLLHVLASQPWPGNVRELESFLDRLMDLGAPEILDVPALEAAVSRDTTVTRERQDLAWKSTLRRFQKQYLEWAVVRWGPSAAHVADGLQVSRTYVYRLCRNHGVELPATIGRSCR